MNISSTPSKRRKRIILFLRHCSLADGGNKIADHAYASANNEHGNKATTMTDDSTTIAVFLFVSMSISLWCVWHFISLGCVLRTWGKRSATYWHVSFMEPAVRKLFAVLARKTTTLTWLSETWFRLDEQERNGLSAQFAFEESPMAHDKQKCKQQPYTFTSMIVYTCRSHLLRTLKIFLQTQKKSLHAFSVLLLHHDGIE